MAQLNTMTPQVGQAPVTDDTAAVATLTAPTDGKGWVIDSIGWSYSNTPTGSLVIAWGLYAMTFYVLAKGPSQIQFTPPLKFPANTQVVITLTAGGGGVYGTVYPSGRTGD